MQLGMIGLGRMGANMVRRLIDGGHECVVFDRSPEAVDGAGQGEGDRRRLARRLRREAREAARRLADGPGGRRRQDRSPSSLPLLETGDILIDGGNSYYVDDIRRAKELAAEGHPLRRRRHERRRVGPRARLLHDDRRRDRRRAAPRSDLRDARARHRRHPAHAGPREGRRAPPSTATCTAGRTAPATSSRWCTTASSTASWPRTPKGSASCATPTSARQTHDVDAETTPLRDPEHYQYDLNLRDIAEVWRRGSVIASWLLDLTAIALLEDPPLSQVRRPRVRLRRGTLDDQGRDRRGGAGAGAHGRALRSASARAARPTSRTSCCRRCASSSADTSRSRRK